MLHKYFLLAAILAVNTCYEIYGFYFIMQDTPDQIWAGQMILESSVSIATVACWPTGLANQITERISTHAGNRRGGWIRNKLPHFLYVAESSSKWSAIADNSYTALTLPMSVHDSEGTSVLLIMVYSQVPNAAFPFDSSQLNGVPRNT